MQNSFENIPVQLRGLLIFVCALALIVAAYFLMEDADPLLQIALIWGIIVAGLVAAYFFMRTPDSNEAAVPSPVPPVRAAVPLDPLPPYQLKQQEPTITVQIPARTVVALVLVLAFLFMIYLRYSRSDDV